ncbi:MAG: flippase-like domain-containing protein [Salinivirgaceae bacterium]|nr:flippase-like domain-containing protein [Salinivirgaceae bacterium]
MSDKSESQLQKIKISRVILPTFIGLGVVVYLMFRNFDVKAFDAVQFTYQSVFWLLVAAFMMFLRDFGYVVRIKILTGDQLTWIQAIRIILLWEFTSAITPSAIGGTGVAILYVNKEGISLGKSSAVVMATSFLDEMYFVILFPLLLLFINTQELFAIGGGFSFTNPFLIAAITGYSIKFLWVIIISYGLFVNPRGFKWFVLLIFKLPFLRKWRAKAHNVGDDIIISSKELKSQKKEFWLKTFAATFFSWTARYWVVNALFLAFFTVGDHFLLFARQLVMWIMMLVSPTPGGSGFTEYVFTEYLGDLLPYTGVAVLMALLWRLFTYYPYLFIGVYLFPRWVRMKFKKKAKKT